MEEFVFRSPRYRRLSDQVYRQVKEAVLSGRYKPGDRLPSEKELSEIFGVGRPVIREALRFLESIGLVSVRPGAGGGAFVREIEPRVLAETFEGIVRVEDVTMEELTEARMAIELAILPLVVKRISQGDIKELEINVKEARESLEKGIREPKNLKFHIILAKASRNRLLSKITEAVFRLLAKLLQQYEYSYERKKKILEDHEQIMKLLKHNDYERLQRALERHIRDTLKLFK